MGSISKDFWKNKKVLVTGHTGFKGAWLIQLLKTLSCKVAGYSLAPATQPSIYQAADLGKLIDLDVFADIRDAGKLKNTFGEFQPEIVIHLAAQALVQTSFKDPTETWSSNVMGTLSVLEAVRSTRSVTSVAVVTTDKCYWNDGQAVAFRESDPLGGKDPYSASKAGSEMVAASHYHTFFKNERPQLAMVTLRAGNIIGGGDWSDNRLMTDIVRSALENKPLTIRMPQAVRPWQYVLDALRGYLLAIEKARPGTFDQFNFAPQPFPQIQVKEILEMAKKSFAGLKWNSPETKETREAATLSLDALKANRLLDWKPELSPEELVHRTLSWYSQYYQNHSARQLCQAEIETYLGRA